MNSQQHGRSRASRWSHLAIACLIPMAATGCRAPWLARPSAEPSFDSLIDIQRSKARQTGRRPGDPDSQMTSRLAESLGDTGRRAPQDRDPNDQFDLADLADDLGQEKANLLLRTLQAKLDRKSDSSTHATDQNRNTESADQDSGGISFKLSDDDDYSAPSPNQRSEPRLSRKSDLSDLDRKRAGNLDIQSGDGYASRSKQDYDPADSSNQRLQRYLDKEIVPASHARKSSDRELDEMDTDSRETARQTQNISMHDSDLSWGDMLREASVQMDAEIIDATNPDLKVELDKKRRLLSLVMDDLESAMEPVSGLDTDLQQYIQHNIQSLHVLTDPTGHPHPRKRPTLALQSARTAIRHLSAASDLEVENAAFCTSVESFGDFSPFDEFTFQPGQEVLLYCEIDNFVSKQTPDGKNYETHLRGSYQIVGTGGNRIDDQSLPANQHLSSSQRRDYFMVYRIWMPKTIAPGEYQVKLAIEDLNGRKFGHETVNFKISP